MGARARREALAHSEGWATQRKRRPQNSIRSTLAGSSSRRASTGAAAASASWKTVMARGALESPLSVLATAMEHGPLRSCATASRVAGRQREHAERAGAPSGAQVVRELAEGDALEVALEGGRSDQLREEGAGLGRCTAEEGGRVHPRAAVDEVRLVALQQALPEDAPRLLQLVVEREAGVQTLKVGAALSPNAIRLHACRRSRQGLRRHDGSTSRLGRPGAGPDAAGFLPARTARPPCLQSTE